MRVSQGEFVKVVYMSDAEVERSEKDNFRGSNPGQNVDRNEDGSKQHFFSDGASNVIAVALPTA